MTRPAETAAGGVTGQDIVAAWIHSEDSLAGMIDAALNGVRAATIAECIATLKALHQPFSAAGMRALQFEDTVHGRALLALAAALSHRSVASELAGEPSELADLAKVDAGPADCRVPPNSPSNSGAPAARPAAESSDHG